MTLRRLAVLPSGREVPVRLFVPLRAVETSTEAALVVGRAGYAYRPERVFYAAGREDGTTVVKALYRRARRGASNG